MRLHWRSGAVRTLYLLPVVLVGARASCPHGGAMKELGALEDAAKDGRAPSGRSQKALPVLLV